MKIDTSDYNSVNDALPLNNQIVECLYGNCCIVTGIYDGEKWITDEFGIDERFYVTHWRRKKDMRKKAKTDDNQAEIVSGLREFGCTVVSMANLGNGTPDILTGFRGKNWLFEIKDGSKHKSQKKLTHDEETFFNSWQGQVDIVESLEDAMHIMGLYKI